MSVAPVVRHLIACKKEPTLNGADPSVHDIMYTIRPKKGTSYPLWQRPFYVFAMIAGGRGPCAFRVEMRLVALDADMSEVETNVGSSKSGSYDFANDPLSTRFLSLMMPPILLPKSGVYRLCAICDDSDIGAETVFAR